jgi:hypothetical protein
MTLKINDFNLGYYKKLSMLTPHRYLTRMKGKKSRIIPQPWTMDLTQSTILYIMKYPIFEGPRRLIHALSSNFSSSMDAIFG